MTSWEMNLGDKDVIFSLCAIIQTRTIRFMPRSLNNLPTNIIVL